jgi:BolA family transcriptional regulator, general stress-responsive regulator
VSVADRIESSLAALAPESLEVIDESAAHAGHAGARSGGGHYRLVIVARAFEGKPAQLRHRMVYDALAPMMKHEIHALAIKAYAPGEI